MKKFRILAYIIIAIIIISVGIIIFKKLNKNDNQKEKTLAETKYVESKFVNLINTINNIKDENYNISISKIPAESKNVASGNSTSSKGETQSDSKEEMGGKQQDEGRKFKLWRRLAREKFKL